jgi:hypothetical protein
MSKRFLTLLLPWLACAPPQPIPGVVRPNPGEKLKSITGPMPGFGPFDSRLDALLAACPLILSKPRATAGRPSDQNFEVRWRLSSEYCAWLYYTPDSKYEMSMLVEGSSQDDLVKRSCQLPLLVEDKRYPLGSLKYVYILHNHPAPLTLSEKDVRAIVEAAKAHGRVVETKEGSIPVAIIAFFSNSSDPESPSCDGFFEYSLQTNKLVRWSPDEHGHWSEKKAGAVTWFSETRFRIDLE